MKLRTLALMALVALTLGVSANRSPVNNARPVTFDVVVTDKDGSPIAGLQRNDFRVFEDNVEQTLTSFRPTREPLAVVILAESGDVYSRAERARAAEGFARNLRPDDWVLRRLKVEVAGRQDKVRVRHPEGHYGN